MTSTTPDDARRILAGVKKGDGFSLHGEWCDALKALAADTLEYRVEHQHIDNGTWHPITRWSPGWPLNVGCSVASDERIVARRVSTPWVEVTSE